jgi:hypothetical protein
MPLTKFMSNPGWVPDLPAEGYPFSEHDLRAWYRLRYGREASDLEVGAMMDAMVLRQDHPGVLRQDHPGPDEPRPEPGGWRVELAAQSDDT